MTTAILLARITVTDGFKNRSQLDVRRAENDELVLRYFNSSTCLSLSNMQAKRPAPAFCVHGDDPGTVDMVTAWLGCTLVKVASVERGPSARRAAPRIAFVELEDEDAEG